MAGTLTQEDIATLQLYVENEDRYSYWNYLAQAGDPYAALALGVPEARRRLEKNLRKFYEILLPVDFECRIKGRNLRATNRKCSTRIRCT